MALHHFEEVEIHSNVEIKDNEPSPGRVTIYYHRAGNTMKTIDMPKKLFVKALDKYLDEPDRAEPGTTTSETPSG